MKEQPPAPCEHAPSPPPVSARVAQRVSLLYPLVGALCIPLVIGMMQPALITLSWDIFTVVVGLWVAPLLVIKILIDWTQGDRRLFQGIWEYLCPIPSGLAFGPDRPRTAWPWVTTTLVCTNVVLYSSLPDDLVEHWMFLPCCDPSLLRVLLSVGTSAFLHADQAHLWGNMFFVWTVGSTLEPRMSIRHYLTAYGLGMVCARLVPIVFFIMQALHQGTPVRFDAYHSLGASGAISGIMGLFIVRCYFARMAVSFPFVFLPFLSLSLRLQAIVFVGLFFTVNMAGSVEECTSDAGGLNYWAHVGGYLGGLVLAYLWHLHRGAAQESRYVKAARLTGDPVRWNEAARLYTALLEEDPEHEGALRYFLHRHKRSPKEAAGYYARLIPVLLRTDIRQAIDLFNTYYPHHMRALPGEVLFRLGTHFSHEGEFVKARHCLDMAAERAGPWQPKAMLLLGKTFEVLGNDERAKQLYLAIAEQYPESDFQTAALEKLGCIEQRVE